ncbi:hypothetical protein CC86DRAFT_371989 [Ophiobolus disseminans]|uniref:Macro domain-containing protein n=1 Tax=Ophiobolus disseminans TaxID=1469910 RepID=A0A6A6ZTV7_9PLEO|nr:hypothetical protein CC86DRAFT_371989 [Ophiobolus disseminans]
MSSIRLATASNVWAFQALSHELSASDNKWTGLIDREALEDEIGRFRVWSGNLGALQKGHSSLDYRLRDSPLLSSNALKFLEELENNINEALAVVTGARLPYELQPKQDKSGEEEDDDDDFFDEDDEDEDEDSGSRSELSMRFAEIVDIVDNLYKLSVRIRTPTIRSRSLKAATYKPKDPETGVDLLSTYAVYDLQHIKELLCHLRQPHQEDVENSDYDYLITRLSAAITLRRRQFKYWRRHRDKLGMATGIEETTPDALVINRPDPPQRNDTSEAQPEIPTLVVPKEAPSHKTGKTLLSGTEATQHHQSLDEIVDTKSVTSYAVTVKDLHGKGVELPPPPHSADGEKDFECPYCYIICPARYGRGRAWRTHLLQDLQPYVCTFPDCDSSEQLFRSRREWAEHEASHRKAWRCIEHPGAVYKSSIGLEDHLRREHADSLPDSQLPAIVKVGETTTVDVRSTCPICCASTDTEGLGDLHNHIANHLERIATFALPTNLEEDADGASSMASRGGSESDGSRNMSGFSDSSDTSTELVEKATTFNKAALEDIEFDTFPNDPRYSQGVASLSAQSLSQLPDASHTRLNAFFPTQENQLNDPSNQSELTFDENSSSVSSNYDQEGDDQLQKSVLGVSDIPTLRQMYRSRQLLQRDQVFAPNDYYNRIISFCCHDLTQLKVDAIVNSASRAIRSTSGDTLNNSVHRVAGSAMAKEAKSKGRPKADLAVITGGYNLPSKHVIHTFRPRDMTQFDQLAACYHSALDLAITSRIKTIAFPCIGTGGVGFPPRVAARTALEEMRKYLDGHPEHGFERLVFCVNTAVDEKAYMDFLPIYFPPTHGDLDEARSSVWSEDRAALAAKLLDTRNQVQKVLSELTIGLNRSVPNFPQAVLNELSAIDSGLASIRRYLLWSQEVSQSLQDLRLVCSVTQLVCGSIGEIMDLAKEHVNLGQQSDKSIWEDYISDMQGTHDLDLSQLLEACHYFIESLQTLISREGIEVDQMIAARQILERYRTKQNAGRRIQNHLNEVLYSQEFERETVARAQNIVTLQQIPSISQLYKLGELEEKPTQARPSAMDNHTVCFTREDITKLEVDVIVNSTDMGFGGTGALNRTVLAKGGVQLREAVSAFGMCAIGDVRASEGYLLPAKHVLHVVPPNQLNKDTKDILRKVYRKALQLAVTLRATSIAFPSIGTGMLNYPRRDCATLAMEEIKRFLETAEPKNLIEKIVFVVYSSNDEFIYKSFLPVYFPPIDLYANRALPASQPGQAIATSSSSEPSDAPRRSIFGSIGEAYRSVRFGKLPAASRPISTSEEHALINFESHAKDCVICKDVETLYSEGHDLCADGYSKAQLVLWYMNMQSDNTIWSKPDSDGQIVRIDVPIDLFPFSTSLLAMVERSYRDNGRSRPFVSPDRPYGEFAKDQSQKQATLSSVADEEVDLQATAEKAQRRTRAHILAWSKADGLFDVNWKLLTPDECDIRVDTAAIVATEIDTVYCLLKLQIADITAVQRHKTAPEVTLTTITNTMGKPQNVGDEYMFRCRSDPDCSFLLRMIRRAIEDFKEAHTSESQKDIETPHTATSPGTATEYHKWNQRLHDIREELTTMKRASGGLTDLQFKMERLSQASSSLHSTAHELEAASELYSASRSPLATRILVCLTADLKSRPGSYIGLDTDSIVSTLRATREEVSLALEELVAEDQIHNTVDENTWVVSHPPKDLPVLPEEQRGISQAQVEPSATPAPPGLSRLELWLLSTYVFAISSEADITMEATADAATALIALGAKVKWYDISGTLMDPQLEPGYSVSGIREGSEPWTCIHQNIVDPRVLRDIGIEFEDRGTYVVLRRSLKKGELYGWATRSNEIRQLQDPGEPLIINTSLPGGTKTDVSSDLEQDFMAQEPSNPQSLSPLAKQVHAYMATTQLTSAEAHHIADITTSVDKSIEEVRQTLAELEKRDMAQMYMNDRWWYTTWPMEQDTEAQHEAASAPSPTAVPSLNLIMPSPPTQRASESLLREPTAFDLKNRPEEEETSKDTQVPQSTPSSEVRDLPDLNLIAPSPPLGQTQSSDTEPLDDPAPLDLGVQSDNQYAPGSGQQHKSRVQWANMNVVHADANDAKQMQKEERETPPSSSSAAVQNAPDSEHMTTSHNTAPSSPRNYLTEQELETLDISRFYGRSFLNPQHTRIDKRLVDPRALTSSQEVFMNVQDALIIQRTVWYDEVEKWAKESARMRRHDEEVREERDRDVASRRSRGAVEKGKGRDARDEYQERLDRVIAGDMEEEELRRFKDKDGERFK